MTRAGDCGRAGVASCCEGVLCTLRGLFEEKKVRKTPKHTNCVSIESILQTKKATHHCVRAKGYGKTSSKKQSGVVILRVLIPLRLRCGNRGGLLHHGGRARRHRRGGDGLRDIHCGCVRLNDLSSASVRERCAKRHALLQLRLM